MWGDGWGNLCLLILCQPVPPSKLFPLRLHLIPELRIWLQMAKRERESVSEAQLQDAEVDEGWEERLVRHRTTTLVISHQSTDGNVTSVGLSGSSVWTAHVLMTHHICKLRLSLREQSILWLQTIEWHEKSTQTITLILKKCKLTNTSLRSQVFIVV